MEALKRAGVGVVALALGFGLGAVWHWKKWPPYETVRGLYLSQAELPDRPEPGFWSKAPTAQDIEAQLHALGYLSGVSEPAGPDGVRVHDAAAVAPGLNLYTSGHANDVLLMDRDGKVVHRWALDFGEVVPLPEREITPFMRSHQYIRRALLLPDGDLLAMWEGWALVRVGPDGAVRWALRDEVHHAIEVDADGRVLTLARRIVDGDLLGRDGAVLDDVLLWVDPTTGAVQRELSLLRAIHDSPWRSLLHQAPTAATDFMFDQLPGDVLHTNDIDVLTGHPTLAAMAPGHLLLSIRHLRALVVVDPSTGAVVWAASGQWHLQHDPHLLADGTVLLFDNQGAGDASRAIAVDPEQRAITWQYGGRPDEPLWSRRMGAVQRLGNGNTLITSTEEGRVIEVTTDGRVVWAFSNPERAGEGDAYIAVVPEMTRVDPPAWLPAQ